MNLSLKRRLEGTKAQEIAQARSFAIAALAHKILAAKRAAKA